ncbi:TetR/AcrR family transcriptional regulator [Bdellovibrio sp. 22V]|uniref:TetR/AcrR family transcriptional regulator n=1 Tax=Bdellovibrio TaxID=958 RepID=UPI00254352E0|nr:TetR/AcrR family transcriptional regulator [Bdellovibrio sp. 22V]WII72794.1 TetR/AcrR family transcriptional regulator [Bdellovibrio sp. 22V]
MKFLIMTQSAEEKDKAKKTKIIVKAPTQERSRQTVATILDACSRLLISEGFYAITTDKIAKEAGVSIGSLYQFFGNKESVVQAVVKNIIEEDKRIISERMRAISPLPPPERVKAMIELAVDTIRRNSELRAKLTTIQYYVADAAYISDSIRFYQEVVRYNLPQLPGRDMDKVSYLVVNAFIGLVNTMSIDKPNYIHDNTVVQEITQLFFKYLDMDALETPTTSAGAVRQNKGDFI